MKKNTVFTTLTLTLLSILLPLATNLLAHEKEHHETMEMNQSSEENHHHKTIMIMEGQPVPSVDLMVHQDSLKGWNLEIKLNNFTFTPENVNQANQPNEGHAHLYINGEKITRIYGNWYYLAELPSGNNEVKIELNTNSHESLMYQEQKIADQAIITVP